MFKKVRILVIGDVMIDHYVYGTVERLSPEAPVPILEMREETIYLGGAGLVAANLAHLGATVDFATVCGEDKDAKTIQELLKSEKIETNMIVHEKGRKTILKKRFVAIGPYFQQLLRMDNETKRAISKETEAQLLSKIKSAIEKTDLVLISDYNKGMLIDGLIKEIINVAKKFGKKIVVDTKYSMNAYKGVDYVVPNFKELCLHFALYPSNEDEIILPYTKKLTDDLNTTIIVKRSGKGATIADKTGIRTHSTSANDIVNVSGAGDIFVSILSVAIASGMTIDEAVKHANTGCAKAIGRKHPSIFLDDFK